MSRPTPQGELNPDADSKDENPAFAIERFIMQACDELVGVELDKLGTRQLLNAARRFGGSLASYAIEQRISPPEKAILDLSEEAEIAAKELLTEAMNASANSKKPLHHDTIKRFRRIVDFIEGIDDDTTRQPQAESPQSLTLGQVVKLVSVEDGDLRYIEALERVRAEMVDKP